MNVPFKGSIARDRYRWHCDMLADRDRNAAYAQGLRRWAKNLAPTDRPVVLYIGTGSGLLASLAARELALRSKRQDVETVGGGGGDGDGTVCVCACECVEELHAVAAETFRRNGDGAVLLSPCHSTELPRPSLCAGAPRANSGATLVVAELLDTGLLGEGLIASMHDAVARLASSEEPLVSIPSAAEIYAAPVEGDLAYKMGGIRSSVASSDSSSDFSSFRAPAMCATCEGCGSAEGMHIRFDDRRGLLSCLAAPRAVLSFPSFLSLPKAQTLVRTTFVATRAGTVHGVAYWWEVQMLPPGGGGGGGGGTNNRNSEEDEAGGGIATSPSMSTAPGRTPLPDHWRQNLIPLQTPLEVAEGQTVELAFSHDADECWVDVRVGGVFSDRPPATGGPARAEVEGGVGSKGDGCRGGGRVCTCGVHASFSRLRLLAVNDEDRRAVLRGAVDAIAFSTEPESNDGSSERSLGVLVVLGDGPLAPFFAASRGFSVLVLSLGSSNSIAQRVEKCVRLCLEEAGLLDRVVFAPLKDEDEDEAEDDDIVASLVQEHFPAESIRGIVTEPFFAEIDEPGSSAGGWGFESLLLTWSLMHRSVMHVESKASRQPKKQRVTKEPPKLLPSRAVLRGSLISSPGIFESLSPPNVVEGIDMSAAADLLRRPASHDAAVDAVPFVLNQWMAAEDDGCAAAAAAAPPWRVTRQVSPVVDLLVVDLAAGPPAATPLGSETTAKARVDGPQATIVVHGLALWIDYYLGCDENGGEFEEKGEGDSAWLRQGPDKTYGRQGFLAFAEPLSLKRGTCLDIATSLGEDGSLSVSVSTASCHTDVTTDSHASC
jgi:predicted RNA methylase